MHAVVNHLPIKPGVDWGEMTAQADRFFVEISRDHPKLRAALLLKSTAGEAIFLGVYDDLATLHQISTEIAAPWFAENMRPYLSGPVARSVGEVVAGDSTWR